MGSEVCAMCSSPERDAKTTIPEGKNAMTGNRRVKDLTETLTAAEMHAASSSDSDYAYDSSASCASTATVGEPTYSLGQQKKARSGFETALRQGNESLVMHYCREFSAMDLLHMPFANGDTCLHVAVRNRSEKLVLFLLSENLSPNDVNSKTGDTSLHAAVRGRDLRTVALLCKFGGDANVTNNAHETPLSIASDNGDADILELLSPETQQAIHERLATDINGKQVTMPDMNKLPTIDSPTLHASVKDILDDNMDDHEMALMNSYSKFQFPKSEGKGGASGHSKESSLEAHLSDRDMRNLTTHRISKSNPFTRLKRQGTRQALEEMQDIARAKDHLPDLKGWLEKKQHSVPYSWQKRWVVLLGSHLLWTDRQKPIGDAKDHAVRKRFGHSLNIMNITGIEAVTAGKTQRKFKFVVGQAQNMKRAKQREYVWKCATQKDRDFWVQGLKQHQEHMKSLLRYLGTK